MLSSWGKAGKEGTSIAFTKMPGKKKKYNARFPPVSCPRLPFTAFRHELFLL